MKKIISVALCLILVLTFILSLAACGGGDALKGTWTCEDEDYGTVTFTFDGKGDSCKFSNAFFDGKGTYAINGAQVTITLDLWDNEKVYDFTVTGNNLKLTATDGLSPDYDLTKK